METQTPSAFYYTEDEQNYEFFSEGNIRPFLYPIRADWERILRGHVDFTISLITICTNIIMASIFLFRSTRSSTTILLTTLAVSDSVICICKMYEAMFFNILDPHETVYVMYKWCIVTQVIIYINLIFRFTSDWITVILGFQRCISVVMPFRVRTFCSMKFTYFSLLLITPAAVILHMYQIMAFEVVELKIYTSADFNESLPSGCFRKYSDAVKSTLGDRSIIVFYVFRWIFSCVLPSVILTVTTVLLAVALRKNSRAIRDDNISIKDVRILQCRKITIIVLTILLIFLISELQDGISFIIYIVEIALDKQYQILSEEQHSLWNTVASTLTLLSYACNFWIFFMMSNQFRSALINMLKEPFKKTSIKCFFDTLEPVTSETDVQGNQKPRDDQSLLH